jgi:uncharacterized protein YjcR
MMKENETHETEKTPSPLIPLPLEAGEEKEEGTGKRGGAPKGNQNARKHGFYSKVLSAEVKQDAEQAVEVEGLEEEIAIMRAKIKAVLAYDPDNVALIARAMGTLASLLRAHYNIGKKDKNRLREVMGNVLKEVATPLLVGLGVVALEK